MNVTKIIITSGELNIGTDATEQDHAEWRALAIAALQKAFPQAEVEVGYTDSMGRVLRLESDGDDDLCLEEQYAVQVLERIW
ncbi:hypothetical protein [Pseudomonas paralcaligenes]|uniref:hypothetical protein n=1 Tax=Pseudomonas paralcaligenes TaxID=2772558 RepID=UPI001C81CE26|nr:hypothetical protein [Pseudomonas paralcaligenes]